MSCGQSYLTAMAPNLKCHRRNRRYRVLFDPAVGQDNYCSLGTVGRDWDCPRSSVDLFVVDESVEEPSLIIEVIIAANQEVVGVLGNAATGILRRCKHNRAEGRRRRIDACGHERVAMRAGSVHLRGLYKFG